MSQSVGQFVQHLTASGLMSAADVAAFQDALPRDHRPQDAESLARELVRAKKLTRYQAQVVYQGKTKGLVFGEYRVLDKLGQGGMGVVLKAEHRRMKRLVAVKMIAGAALKSPDAQRRFYREVEAAAKLNHPNIVQAHDASEHEGIHYLVMEYVDGKDLAGILKERGSLPVAEAVECILQAARGLQYAHKQGIVHRDIKPANLLVDKEGTVKILDMGLARIAGLADQEDKDRLTADGQVMGTCDYMAPEQALDAHQADHRADIYSLGCTLYRLVTSEVLYRRESLAQIIVAHQQAPIPGLGEAHQEVPEDLEAVYRRMVAKKPEDRQQSMAAVIADLQRCQGQQTGAATALAERASDSGDRALQGALAFLDGGARVGTATAAKPKAQQAELEETQARHVEQETHTSVGIADRLRALPAKKKAIAAAVGLALLGVLGVVCFGVVIRIVHPDGKETVLKVPDGTEVSIDQDGQVDVRVKGPTYGPDAPPLAVAPFDAKQAKAHQEAWAKYLGVPVEMENSIGMKLVLIPPGEFMMGSTPGEEVGADQQPQHRVRITRPFLLGAHEVTVGQFRRFVDDMGYKTTAETNGKGGWHFDMETATFKGWEDYSWQEPGFQQTDTHPILFVTWHDAIAFCQWLGRREGKSYRLPTEAEHECACRAGTTDLWFTGKHSHLLFGYVNIADAAFKFNCPGWSVSSLAENDGYVFTSPVGSFKPNPFGLYDMYGNAVEWCEDWYDEDFYRTSPEDDPCCRTMGRAGRRRTVRGGTWRSSPWTCSSVSRCGSLENRPDDGIGFRVVWDTGSTSGPQTPGAASSRAQDLPTAKSSTPVTTSLVTKPLPPWTLPLGAPPPAIAPFDAKKAKAHQEAWAKYLGVPVEMTNSIGMKLALIPPGEFDMGSTEAEVAKLLEEAKATNETSWYIDRLPSEAPRHRVRITKPFWLGRHEVTRGQFRRFVDDRGYQTDGERDGLGGGGRVSGQWKQDPRFVWNADLGFEQADDSPVVNVSWNDVTAFCVWLSEKEGETANLPSEAQWEYACRAGTTTMWYSGDKEGALDEHEWLYANSEAKTHPVGQKAPNVWGLHDMHGNVHEWCQGWLDNQYFATSPTNGPTSAARDSMRANRGGSWIFTARHGRAPRRNRDRAGFRNYDLGFRVARSISFAGSSNAEPKKSGPETPPPKAPPEPKPSVPPASK